MIKINTQQLFSYIDANYSNVAWIYIKLLDGIVNNITIEQSDIINDNIRVSFITDTNITDNTIIELDDELKTGKHVISIDYKTSKNINPNYRFLVD